MLTCCKYVQKLQIMRAFRYAVTVNSEPLKCFPKISRRYFTESASCLTAHGLFLRQLGNEKLDKRFKCYSVSLRTRMYFAGKQNAVFSSYIEKLLKLSPVSHSKICRILALNKYFKINFFFQQCYFFSVKGELNLAQQR